MFRFIEAFYSFQGEGKYVGVPSVFVRLFGCNFKCQGFGMPKGELSNEYLNIDAKKYTKLDDVPLVRTGCDSFVAWDPRFKHLTRDVTPAELAKLLVDLTPTKSWVTPEGQEIHLVITGGEPLLGWQKQYIELFTQPEMQNLNHVTFETNTTQTLNTEFRRFVEIEAKPRFTWSCSPKLSVSGEDRAVAIQPLVAREYFFTGNSDMYFKFVVADENDFKEIDEVVKIYREFNVKCPVYCMPVGGCFEEYSENNKTVANLALSKGYRYSPRLHVDIWGNTWAS